MLQKSINNKHKKIIVFLFSVCLGITSIGLTVVAVHPENIELLNINSGTNGTNIYNNTFTINWTKTESTAYYYLQISNNSDFADEHLILNLSDVNEINYPTLYSDDGTTVSFIVSNLLPGYGTYFTRVKAYHVEPWWNSSWLYRKEVTISGDFPDGYQFNFTIFNSTTLDGNACVSDFRDIRFVDRTVVLPYWIENYTSDTRCNVWVKKLSNDTHTFYMYYGNSNTNDKSNGNDTFNFFDSFSDNTIGYSSELISSTTYDAWGTLFKPNDYNLVYVTSVGTQHLDRADIKSATYNLSTKTWGGLSTTVYNSIGSKDARDVGGGMINDTMYAFFATLTRVTEGVGVDEFDDIGYATSTDGGVTWSGYTTISLPYYLGTLSEYSPYGHLFRINNSFFQPMYGWNNTDTPILHCWLSFLRSDDWGATWYYDESTIVYNGTTRYVESCFDYIGDGKVIGLIRYNTGGAPYYLYQTMSSDYGHTWSVPVITNIAGVVPWVLYDEGNLITVVAERVTDHIISFTKTNATTVFSSPTSWNAQIDWKSDSVDVAYPTFVELSNNTYYAVWYREVSSSDADTWGGYVPKWESIGSGSASVSSGKLTLNNDWLYSIPEPQFGINYSIRAYGKMSATTVRQQMGFSNKTAQGTSQDIQNGPSSVSNCFENDGHDYIANYAAAQTIQDGGLYNVNYHIYDIIRNSTTNTRFFDNGTEITNSPIATNVPSNTNMKVHLLDYLDSAGSSEWDWILVRKYIYPEPTLVIG